MQAFWDAHPCGDAQVGGLRSAFDGDHAAFFDAYDAFRYRNEPHILQALDRFDWAGKAVLEIGLGQGADAEQLIRRGARWSGVDLTPASVDRVATRMRVRGLPHGELKVGSALALPFADASFDVVFSHGVLHHIPEIGRAQAEIARVLKPGGRLVMMVYARHSLNYQLAIRVVRRAGLALLYATRAPVRGIYREHVENARREGLGRYLRLSHFVHRSTDGPGNPYSKVYAVEDIPRDFPAFEVMRSFKLWLNAPPLPTRRWPGGSLLGWHLWAELKPRAAAARDGSHDFGGGGGA